VGAPTRIAGEAGVLQKMLVQLENDFGNEHVS
jgi:hypothetical protein